VIDKLAAAGIPYKDPSRLVLIWLRSVHETGPSKMFDSFRDYRAFARGTAAATWATGGRLLRGYGPAQGSLAMPVSESFFARLAGYQN
jgi:hypothetical protein